MDIDGLIFTENLPKLDLHGIDVMTSKVYINDFIRDNYKLKNKFVIIIHGVGTGKLRNATKEVLNSNKCVSKFKTDNFNHGCTIVQIKNWLWLLCYVKIYVYV